MAMNNYSKRGMPITERLLSKVNSHNDNECWEWNASLNTSGYGQIKIDGKTRLAHRASYEAFVGPIPDKLLACHKCDNPLCINPDHLFIGSKYNNCIDMVNKGRSNRQKGEHHRDAKLKESDIVDIRCTPKKRGYVVQLAKKYNMSESTISCIANNRSWKHVIK